VARLLQVTVGNNFISNITNFVMRYTYRPISLLPIISKLLEKLLLKRLYSDTNLHDWIPSHQFGFRKAHSKIQQCHRITDIINKAFEKHKYCSAVFLDVSQAFDKVWHQGLLFKIKQTLPTGYLNILKSYLSNRYFTHKAIKCSKIVKCIGWLY
jgi:hypothetical protein